MYEQSDLRIVADRRKRPTPLISRFTFFGGRRGNVRRREDTSRYQFVDRYGTMMLIVLLSLFGLTQLDGFLTLMLVEGDIAVEANPAMAYCLELGAVPFILAKTLITALSICIFCLCHRFLVARVSLVCAIAVYFVLVVYEVSMLFWPQGAVPTLS
ncbi:MAG: DUF5658 family protein [Chloroflexota bacterium]